MYELKQVGARTYYIQCPSHIGIYVSENGDACAIDTGNNKDYGKKIIKYADENGWTLKYVINTHPHADHMGGNALVAERTGCKILCYSETWAMAQYPIFMPSVIYGAHAPAPLSGRGICAKACAAEELTESNIPYGLEFTSLPGHSIQQIAVKTPDGVWFVGDSLVSEDTLKKYHVSYLYNVEDYLRSLEKLKTLSGSLFIPSHAEPAADIAPLADANRAQVYELIAVVESLCSSPKTTDEIIKGVFDHYGMSLDLMQFGLSGSSLRAYISYLFDSGALTYSVQDNTMRWVKSGEKKIDFLARTL